MILNTGSRTDIPAFFSEWFYNRLRAGYVLARNPFYPSLVTRYSLDPQVVDALVFCTKNPAPMFSDFDLLRPFQMFWFVTITPYGKDIEPNVPSAERVAEAFLKLSEFIGRERTSWRYDPVFISAKYSAAFHIGQFEKLARRLCPGTRQCVVSFIDLYEKTRRNFPEAREVTFQEQRELIEAFSSIAAEHGMKIHLCCENERLVCRHVDAGGCLSRAVLEEALGCKLRVSKRKAARPECSCLLGSDIGAYNTCGHGCLYCYANYDRETVMRNMRLHDKHSPFLIGGFQAGDVIREARQESWKDGQTSLFDLA